jgi:prepilin peptidase CpaA
MSLSLPLAELARGAVIAAFLVLLAIASISDIRYRTIPNWLVLAICALAVPWILLEPNASFVSSGEAILVAFLISFPLYLAGLVGAGDSKLLMAAALMVGAPNLMLFLVIVALAGGAIAAVSMLRDPNRALVMFHLRGKGNFGRGVPYGVAIAIGAALVTGFPLVHRPFG